MIVVGSFFGGGMLRGRVLGDATEMAVAARSWCGANVQRAQELSAAVDHCLFSPAHCMSSWNGAVHFVRLSCVRLAGIDKRSVVRHLRVELTS